MNYEGKVLHSINLVIFFVIGLCQQNTPDQQAQSAFNEDFVTVLSFVTIWEKIVYHMPF